MKGVWMSDCWFRKYRGIVGHSPPQFLCRKGVEGGVSKTVLQAVLMKCLYVFLGCNLVYYCFNCVLLKLVGVVILEKF